MLVNNLMKDSWEKSVNNYNEDMEKIRKINAIKFSNKNKVLMQSKKLKKKTIQKLYMCHDAMCGKEYLSLDALRLHTKNKHT